jgi:hypothetical protein
MLPLAVGIIALLVVSAGGWLLWPASSPPVPVPPAKRDTVSRPAFPIQVATEQQIRDHTPTALTILRFGDNPRILVLDFPSLREQGRTLNRVAAQAEKAGLPRDRVLNDSELDQAIRAPGDTIETYYFGHDYSADTLARFFALADRDQIELYPEEESLRALLRQEGWLAPGVTAALISLPAVGSHPKVTSATRDAILRHELSHGEFFSNPAYAEYVHDFWLTALTSGERTAFRGFLAGEEYDTSQEALMYNEMQAYLMFTHDKLFFSADMAGLTPDRLAGLQSRFLAGMPAGWLRDILAGHQAAALAPHPRRRRLTSATPPRSGRRQPGESLAAGRGRSPPEDHAGRHRRSRRCLGGGG